VRHLGGFLPTPASVETLTSLESGTWRGCSIVGIDCQLSVLPKWEILLSVRVLAKSSLQRFWERPGCADARGPLHSWYSEAIKATWRAPQDIKDQYASASICGNDRVVFNIGGNKYRLVVEVQYQAGIVWVKFVGTHAQYDRIDVETVNDY